MHADLSTATLRNCSICTEKGFIHLIVPPEDLETLDFKTFDGKNWERAIGGKVPWR